MKLFLIALLLISWLVCIDSQSPNSKGDTYSGPPTLQCNYGNIDSAIPLPPNQNIKQGRPGKIGPPGLQGPIGPKGQKGETGTSQSLEDELRDVKEKVNQLIDWQTQYKYKNCFELKQKGISMSGVYNISVQGKKTTVYCDMDTGGGGWTVIQKRSNNLTNFYRGWDEYKNGFGSKSGNFWQGLETIYEMTSSASYQLRIDLEDFQGNTAYALYSSFSIGSEATKYKLKFSGYSGTAGDAMTNYNINNMPFATKDRDNQQNCAVRDHGGWWYSNCAYANLNGEYRRGGSSEKYMVWKSWKNAWVSLKKSEMKIKPN